MPTEESAAPECPNCKDLQDLFRDVEESSVEMEELTAELQKRLIESTKKCARLEQENNLIKRLDEESTKECYRLEEEIDRLEEEKEFYQKKSDIAENEIKRMRALLELASGGGDGNGGDTPVTIQIGTEAEETTTTTVSPPAQNIPEGWSQAIHPPTGETYYYNVNTKESVWHLPHTQVEAECLAAVASSGGGSGGGGGARVGDAVGDGVGDAVGDGVGLGMSSSQKIRKEEMSGQVIHCPVCRTEMKCGINRSRTTRQHWMMHEQCLIGMEAMLEDANHKGWTTTLVLNDKLNYDWVAKKKAIEKQVKYAREHARK